MKLCWITIYVKDMQESVKFYKEIVGLEVKRSFSIGEGKHFTFLGSGETEIELIQDENVLDINVGTSISLGFEVPNVEEKIKEIREGGLEIQDGPFSPNPSIIFFYVLDPNGLKIQFVENKR